MNVLYLYNSAQTYTSTVYEHISGFAKYSSHHSFFAHLGRQDQLGVNLTVFDAVVIHYSIRLSFDQIDARNIAPLSEYQGLKALYLQDEYDHTQRIWEWIKRLDIRLVFTVVPPESIERVYPPDQFPGVRFVSVLTGYVPEDLPEINIRSLSGRQILVGYRGRHLPIRYGELGQEKVSVGAVIKRYCEENGIEHDIAWSESARIYGEAWYEFIASCRAILGSESGSNVFDWDGTLQEKIDTYLAANPQATEDQIYQDLIKDREIPGLMNQVSPRIFEAIALRTALVLYEGNYSGTVEPGIHYIPLKKDCSNLDEVFSLLRDDASLENMVERAYRDVIGSGAYSYRTFVELADSNMDEMLESIQKDCKKSSLTSGADLNLGNLMPVTTIPIRGNPVKPSGPLKKVAEYFWMKLPQDTRTFLKPRILALIGKN